MRVQRFTPLWLGLVLLIGPHCAAPPTPAQIQTASPAPAQGSCAVVADQFALCDVGCRPNSKILFCQIYGSQMGHFQRRQDCMRAVVDKLRQDRDRLKTCVDDAERDKAALETELGALRRQRDTLAAQTESARKEADALLRNTKTAEAKIEEANRRYADLNKQLDGVEDGIQEKQKKLKGNNDLARQLCLEDPQCDMAKLKRELANK